jgi:hypothetical protein
LQRKIRGGTVTDYRTATKELQNEVLNVVTKSQTAMVDAIQTWASAIQAITPDLPGLSLPYADKLPRPEEFIATGYDFAEQLLASQRKFAEDVVQATAWALPAGEDAPAKAAAGPARKTTPEAK